MTKQQEKKLVLQDVEDMGIFVHDVIDPESYKYTGQWAVSYADGRGTIKTFGTALDAIQFALRLGEKIKSEEIEQLQQDEESEFYGLGYGLDN